MNNTTSQEASRLLLTRFAEAQLKCRTGKSEPGDGKTVQAKCLETNVKFAQERQKQAGSRPKK